MKYSIEELLFIMYREELKGMVERWEAIIEAISCSDLPTAVCNSTIALKDALKHVDYKIDCEGENDEKVKH